MIVKINILLFLFNAILLVSSLPIENIEQTPNTLQQALPIPVHVVFEKPQNAPEQIVQQVANRLGNAYVSTYDQEKVSVDKTLNAFKDLGQKTIESGISLLKSGLEFIFIVPTFGRNAIVNPQKSYAQTN